MSVSKKDREDYEEGRRDAKKNIIDQTLIDIMGIHPGTDPYDKGRRGEQLDEDKKDKKGKPL